MKYLFEGNSDNKYTITLQFLLNNIQIYKLELNEVWLLICFNLNLLLSEKFQENNILPLAVSSGSWEPVNIDTFISPIVDKLQKLSQDNV